MLKHCHGLLVAFLLISGCSTLRAQFDCTWDTIKPAKVAAKEASAVFLGTVESIECKYGRMEELQFSVQEMFKGRAVKKIVVKTSMSDSGGASPFRVGVQYIVYASALDVAVIVDPPYGRVHREFYTDFCHRTRPASWAAADIEYLRHLKTPPDAPHKYSGSINAR
jgi:hypothetical protein